MTPTVGELLGRLRQGRLRLPSYRPPGLLGREDITDVIDSLERGFPIGALVVWQRGAPMGRLDLDVAWLDVPEVHDAWWVISGHRRVVALATLLDAPPAARVLDYRVPVWVLEHGDPTTVADVYLRLHAGARRSSVTEVVNALSNIGETASVRLDELSDRVSRLGMGHYGESWALTSVLSTLDDGPALAASDREAWQDRVPVLAGAIGGAEPAIRQALSFLRHEACVPHLAMLPDPSVLHVLVRFFHHHARATLEPRHLVLLRRWVWRSFLGSARPRGRERMKQTLALVSPANAVDTVLSRLLAACTGDCTTSWSLDRDAREAPSGQLFLLALAQREPRSLIDDRPIDLAAFFEPVDFARVGEDRQDVATWLLHPVLPDMRRRLLGAAHAGQSTLLESHCISLEAIEHLALDDLEAFADQRARDVATIIRDELGPRMAEWNASDRPSISSLLTMPEEDDGDGA